jgi:RimJ/RimL family protein N-acetyltransferase
MAGRLILARRGANSRSILAIGRCAASACGRLLHAPAARWWIAAHARRQGFAKEASRAAVDWAYGAGGFARVETHMNDANEPARRLAEKLGGVVIAREAFPDGITRNVYRLPAPR